MSSAGLKALCIVKADRERPAGAAPGRRVAGLPCWSLRGWRPGVETGRGGTRLCGHGRGLDPDPAPVLWRECPWAAARAPGPRRAFPDSVHRPRRAGPHSPGRFRGDVPGGAAAHSALRLEGAGWESPRATLPSRETGWGWERAPCQLQGDARGARPDLRRGPRPACPSASGATHVCSSLCPCARGRPRREAGHVFGPPGRLLCTPWSPLRTDQSPPALTYNLGSLFFSLAFVGSLPAPLGRITTPPEVR